jgi:hypothetical protein
LLAPEWPIDINHASHVLEAIVDYTNPYMLNGLGMTTNLEMQDVSLTHTSTKPTQSLMISTAYSSSQGPAIAPNFIDSNQQYVIGNMKNSNEDGFGGSE